MVIVEIYVVDYVSVDKNVSFPSTTDQIVVRSPMDYLDNGHHIRIRKKNPSPFKPQSSSFSTQTIIDVSIFLSLSDRINHQASFVFEQSTLSLMIIDKKKSERIFMLISEFKQTEIDH